LDLLRQKDGPPALTSLVVDWIELSISQGIATITGPHLANEDATRPDSKTSRSGKK
jgi:hypothetical protein